MRKLTFLNRFVHYFNLGFALALLVSCVSPYIDDPSLAFLSLSVPLLVFGNVLFVLYWVFRKSVRFLLSATILFCWYFTMGSFVMLKGESRPVSEDGTLKIMTYNSLFFSSKENVWGSTAGDSIVKFVSDQAPDIVSFQEFDYRKIGEDYFTEYPYRFVDYLSGVARSGVLQAVYSKYPILNSGVITFANSANSAIYSDIVYKEDTLRVYNLHLQSLSIRPRSIKRERSDKLFARLRNAFKKQQEQAEVVRNHLDSSPFKNIISGDFNNNQFSNVYFKLKGDYKDTFLEKGNGFGTTINFWRFSFRIDYILVDPSFEVVSHQNYDIDLSDHEPIMASIKITSDK